MLQKPFWETGSGSGRNRCCAALVGKAWKAQQTPGCLPFRLLFQDVQDLSRLFKAALLLSMVLEEFVDLSTFPTQALVQNSWLPE
jgi:hypothetical protein